MPIIPIAARLCRYGLILPAIFLSCRLFAQTLKSRPVKGPVPSWVQPFSYDTSVHPDENDVDGGEYLALFEEQHNLDQSSVYFHIIRRIISEAGVQQASQISIDYAPSYQRLVFHGIRVIRGNDVIDQLDPGRIRVIQNEKDLDRFLYSGLYTAYLPLEDVRPGDRIDYAYTLEGRNPVMDHQYGESLYFNTDNPIAHLYVSLMTDAARPLYFRYFNALSPATRSSWQGKTLYSWTFSNRPVYQEASNVPSWFDGAPFVQVTTFPDWKTVADWAVADLSSAGNAPDPAVSRLSAQWDREAGKNDTAYIRLATRFVQDQIRYMGIEMGPYSRRPHAPAQVLKQRYGDCKDKSLLLVTLLRMRHIPAYVAFVNADNGSQLNQYAPSANLFNHAIVNFEWGDSVYWIDPTISYQRGKITDIATPDYGYALVIRKGTDSLTRMRMTSHRHLDITERFTISKGNKTPGTLEVITRYEGAAADYMRAQWKQSSRGNLEQAYLDYYNKIYTHVSLSDSLRLSDDPVADLVTTREKYLLKEPWQTEDSTKKQTRFIVYAKSLNSDLPDAAEEDRKAPLALPGPVNMDYRIQVITPDEWPYTPSADKIDRPCYRFRYTLSRSGDTLNVAYAYQTFQDYIPADATGLWNKDLKVISNDLDLRLTQNGLVTESRRKISWISVLIAFLSVVFFGWLALRFWRYSPRKQETPSSRPQPIGGWLILIGIGVFFSPLMILYSMTTGLYFTRAIWASVHVLHRFGLGFYMVLMIAGNGLLLVSTLLDAALFFKRRDTFPRAFIFMLSFNMVLLIFHGVMSRHYFGDSIETIGGILRAALYSIIWIPYMCLSERVKNTFVIPYRGKRKEASDAEAGNQPDIVPEAEDPVFGMTPEGAGMDLGGDPVEENP